MNREKSIKVLLVTISSGEVDKEFWMFLIIVILSLYFPIFYNRHVFCTVIRRETIQKRKIVQEKSD